MTLSDFAALCRTLFRNEQGKAYAIEESRLQEMFDVFDRNQVIQKIQKVVLSKSKFKIYLFQDGYVDFQEFAFCWKHWIKPVSPLFSLCPSVSNNNKW